MIELGAEAAQQVYDLRADYEAKQRPEAVQNLLAALIRAAKRIEEAPDMGLMSPRPYPRLAQECRLWIKEGRYWIAYSLTTPPVILAVCFDTANMPRRVR